MPPLEINQSPHTSASVRLDESAAEQVNQYAAFIYTFAADVVGKKLVCSLRERPRLMNTLEAHRSSRSLRDCVSVKAQTDTGRVRPSLRRRGLRPAWSY
jgi:hypothetical protein